MMAVVYCVRCVRLFVYDYIPSGQQLCLRCGHSGATAMLRCGYYGIVFKKEGKYEPAI